MTFGKDEVAQRNGDILGYFLLRQFKKNFHLSKQFQSMFLGILMLQKWFDVDVLDILIEL